MRVARGSAIRSALAIAIFVVAVGCASESGDSVPSGEEVAQIVESKYGITVVHCAPEDTNLGVIGVRYWCQLAEPRRYELTGDTDTEWRVIEETPGEGDYELAYPLSLPSTYCPPSE